MISAQVLAINRDSDGYATSQHHTLQSCFQCHQQFNHHKKWINHWQTLLTSASLTTLNDFLWDYIQTIQNMRLCWLLKEYETDTIKKIKAVFVNLYSCNIENIAIPCRRTLDIIIIKSCRLSFRQRKISWPVPKDQVEPSCVDVYILCWFHWEHSDCNSTDLHFAFSDLSAL